MASGPVGELEKLEDFLTPELESHLFEIFKRGEHPEVIRAFQRILPRNLYLAVVIDASSIISLVRRLHSHGHSLVLNLMKRGFIRCWAPIEQLERDLKGKLQETAERLSVPLERITSIWRDEVAPHIRPDASEAPEQIQGELEAIRRRDPNDVAYVELSFTLVADGVFTTDKDIIQEGNVRILQFGEAVKIASILKRGRLATTFFLQTSMAGVFVGGLLFLALKELSLGLLSLLSKVPTWVWVALAGLILGIMIFPRSRAWARELMQKLQSKLGPLWHNVREAKDELFKVWGPLLMAIPEAQSQLQVLLKDKPSLRKSNRRSTPGSRVPSNLKRKVVACVRKANGPLRAFDVLRKLFPIASDCDLSRVKRQISSILATSVELQKVSRGMYAPRATVQA